MHEGRASRHALHERVLSHVQDVVLVTEAQPLDEPGPRIVYANAAFEAMTGWAEEEVLGRSPRMLQGAATDPAALARVRAALDAARPIREELLNYRRDGSEFWVELDITPLLDDSGRPSHFVSVQRDITERKEREGRRVRQARHSQVTGLVNRLGLVEEIDAALDSSTRSGAPVGLLLFDVRGLRHVNNMLGREAGDVLLAEVARRFERLADGDAVVGHLSGGEFGMVVTSGAVGGLVALSERVQRAMAPPVVVESVEIPVEVTGGITRSSSSSTSTTLLREADIARRATAGGRGKGYAFYDPELGSRLSVRLEMYAGLRRAVERGEMVLHHQPVVALHDGTPTHVEALLRWNRGGTRMVSPAEFIPLAEKTGFITELGRWVLVEACRQAAGWQEQHPGLGVAVNVAPRQIADPHLVSDVELALSDGLPPGLLTLEVTESALLADPQDAATRLRALAERGVRLALDDFGTGYSSMAYLTRLPLHAVKVDKMFVDEVEHNRSDRAVLRAVLSLASDLGMRVVAEGIETSSQRACLLELGCEWGQGFLFARPTPADVMTQAVDDLRKGAAAVR